MLVTAESRLTSNPQPPMNTLPNLRNAEELAAYRADPSRWRLIVAEIARFHGLPESELQDLGGGNLVIAAGPDHVIKFAPPPFAQELEVERLALGHLYGRLPVPTPRVHAAGERDGWRYLIMSRIPGRSLYDHWPLLTDERKVPVLVELGRALSALHEVESPVIGSDWRSFLAVEIPACICRQAGWGVPPALVARIAPFAHRLLDVDDQRTPLLHADLTGQNVLAADDLRLLGIIDFGDAQRGDAHYDLVTPALLLAQGRRPLLAALLDGYGLPPAMRDRDLQLKLMACAAMHRFNPLTRYLGWAPRPPASLEELAEVLFPF